MEDREDFDTMQARLRAEAKAKAVSREASTAVAFLVVVSPGLALFVGFAWRMFRVAAGW